MKCKEGALQLIDEIIEALNVIPQDIYVGSIDLFDGVTIGRHFRHIYDFFNCLTTQCEHDQVDYAQRERDTVIETNKEISIEHFSNLKLSVQDLEESKVLSVYADFKSDDGSRPEVKTTVGRELMYVYDHAIHHLAIIKIGLQSVDPTLPIKKNLGVAASTTFHQYAIVHGH